MGLLRDGLALVRAPSPQRLPMSTGLSGLSAGGVGIGFQQNTITGLSAMAASGWVFAIVDRIASAVASVAWHLYEPLANGDRREIPSHPALDLWRGVNPFYTRHEFIETSQQHFELTGEMWWIVLRNALGQPVELWPVRPDRMRVVPDPAGYVSGYVYRVGATEIPLAISDVIFIRRPSPLDPYRGIGVVQSVLVDLEGERLAAEYSRAFYRNSAEPGGIIEVPEELDNASFQRMVQRWREMHQGVGNAHRVAILEKAKWVDRKYSYRDMQFEQLRHLNRDLLLGAWGIHGSIMGISADINRANAEAAEVHFARWIVRPRLQRIAEAVNERLLPLYGTGQRSEFGYDNPVPDDRLIDLEEADRGYRGQWMTRNEARARLELPPTEDGDGFYEPPAPAAFPPPNDGAKVVDGHLVRRQINLPDPTSVSLRELRERAEAETEAAWKSRFDKERENILKFIDANMAE